MSKPSDRLIARLIAEGHIPAGEYRIERTYAGFWQRREGAFSWELVDAISGFPVNVGSQYTVKECADAEVWEWYGPGIIPGRSTGGEQG